MFNHHHRNSFLWILRTKLKYFPFLKIPFYFTDLDSVASDALLIFSLSSLFFYNTDFSLEFVHQQGSISAELNQIGLLHAQWENLMAQITLVTFINTKIGLNFYYCSFVRVLLTILSLFHSLNIEFLYI